MDVRFKRILSSFLILVLVLSGCANASDSLGDESGGSEETPVITPPEEKPSQITILVDGTLIDQENGRDEFEAKWEELTGIDLVINQPGHDIYYDEVSSGLLVGEIRRTRQELFESLSIYYRMVILGEKPENLLSEFEGQEE